jgi:hypothetical protein
MQIVNHHDVDTCRISLMGRQCNDCSEYTKCKRSFLPAGHRACPRHVSLKGCGTSTAEPWQNTLFAQRQGTSLIAVHNRNVLSTVRSSLNLGSQRWIPRRADKGGAPADPLGQI